MSQQDIETFRTWASLLGCPSEALPGEEALKAVYRTRLRDVFETMVRRVQPRQEVRAIRENLLIEKVEKLKQQALEPEACISTQVCSRAFLPKELQTYAELKDLEKQKQVEEERIEELKKEYELLAGSIKTKNIQHIGLAQKRSVLLAKVNLLTFKNESLDRKLTMESVNNQKILDSIPVRLSAQNSNEQQAMKSAKQALEVLDKFYALHDSNNDPHSLLQSKQELWQQMRSIFAQLPNFLFFNAIMRLMDEQIQSIMSLHATTVDHSNTHSMSGGIAKKPLTAFDMKLMRTKADLLGMVVKFVSARKEREEAEERFAEAYEPFMEALQQKVQMFNADTDEQADEIIGEYVVQYNLRNFNKARNEYVTQQIGIYKQEIEKGAKQLENHEVLLGNVKKVYNDISNSINRLHHDMSQFTQIKDKIVYSKNVMKRLLHEMYSHPQTTHHPINNAKSHFLSTTMKQLNSPGSVNSFELGGNNDTVFCSTKLDFDATMQSLNNTTLMPGANNEGRLPLLPPYTLELNTFADMPLESFTCVPKKCAFYMAANPLVLEPRALSATLQLIPGSTLTPYGALQEVRNRITWAELIATHTLDLKLNLDMPMVDVEASKVKFKKQHQLIEELLDKINMTHGNTQHALEKLHKLYEFMRENPLRRYVPAAKTFNQRSYVDYDAEFTMYYRMVNMGNSMKT